MLLEDEGKEADLDSVLDAVLQTADWIGEQEHRTEHGIFWDVKPGEKNDEKAVLTSPVSLYGGAAGISLFFLRMYTVLGDDRYLEKARQGIRYVMYCHKDGAAYQETGEGTLKGIPAGFMNGPTGGGYVSWLLYEVTGEERFRDYALQTAEELLGAVKEGESGAYWSGAYGLLADGGLILFLIWMYEKTSEKRYLNAAEQAAETVVNEAEHTEHGIRWAAMDSVAFGLGPNGYFPGFFYGTAGTGYILAKLYEHVGNEKYLTYARGAADYLVSVADRSRDGKASLIRYNEPYRRKLYYLGVCQGPVGTSRLFYQLYRLTSEKTYLDSVVKLTNGILRTGAPRLHSPGYWHTYCYCCGAAGMAEHFLSVYQLTGDETYLRAAKDSVITLMRDSVCEDGKRRWYTAWNRHLPDEVAAWTGLYHGSAGCASSLLAYYNFEQEKKRMDGYLEDPYAQTLKS